MNKNRKVVYVLLVTCGIVFLNGCSKTVQLKPSSTKQIPDIKDGVEGKGFTCTGLAKDKDENVYWVGNIGKDLPTTSGFKSTIVKLSNDFDENLGEINIYSEFSSMKDIQGITVDYENDSLWFCSFEENKIRNITKTGEEISFVDINRPTGIAYDSRTDSLWVLSQSELSNITKSGDVIKKIEVSINGQDQIYLDEKNDIIYFTVGSVYDKNNFVYSVDLKTNSIKELFTLEDSYAIEGIHIDDGEMYILNDGYYHDAKIPINQINTYNLNDLI